MVESNGVVRVALNGQPFTEYRYTGVSRPFLYPILGPDGEHFTRRWPQEEVGGEKDHPHHRGMWWAHGDANGVDFWSEQRMPARPFTNRCCPGNPAATWSHFVAQPVGGSGRTCGGVRS